MKHSENPLIHHGGQSGRETAHRFFVSSNALVGELIHFPQPLAHQVARVLRLTAGDLVTVLDNQGNAYRVELQSVTPTQTSGVILSKIALATEPSTQLTLYLPLTRREKFEWMLQKCTEVGASAFVPLVSSRSLVRKSGQEMHRIERWQKILQEAAEQSGRARIPQLMPACHLAEALETAHRENDLCLMAWEQEGQVTLRQVLKGGEHYERVAVLIGPEGGFSKEEAGKAIQNGWRTVSLGARILRMETAAIVATALVLYELELGRD